MLGDRLRVSVICRRTVTAAHEVYSTHLLAYSEIVRKALWTRVSNTVQQSFEKVLTASDESRRVFPNILVELAIMSKQSSVAGRPLRTLQQLRQ